MADQGDLSLLDLIAEFVNAPDWDASRQVLGRSPMLLSAQAEQTLDGLVQMYAAQGDLRLAHHLAMHRDLLRNCRELGYDAAFRLISTPPDETLVRTIAAFIQAEDWPASRAVLDAHPELLEPPTNSAFQALIQAAIETGDDARMQALAAHHDLLRACHRLGIDAAFARVENPQTGEQVEEMMALSVIGHNTLAVMLGEPQHRNEWLSEVRRLQKEADDEGDQQTVALMSAIMKLLNGQPPAHISPTLEGAHKAVWDTIVEALAAG